MLRELDYDKQLAFCYMTCERLYPNYLYFSKKYMFGNPKELRNGIDYIYQNLISYEPNKGVIEALIRHIDQNIPEPAHFDSVLASSSLDACTVINESLDFLIDKDVSRLISISTMATDTVDMYIQEVENLDYNTDKLFQEKIDTHPLMQNEVTIQSGIIFYLRKIDKVTSEDIETLTKLQENNKGNLKLI